MSPNEEFIKKKGHARMHAHTHISCKHVRGEIMCCLLAKQTLFILYKGMKGSFEVSQPHTHIYSPSDGGGNGVQAYESLCDIPSKTLCLIVTSFTNLPSLSNHSKNSSALTGCHDDWGCGSDITQPTDIYRTTHTMLCKHQHNSCYRLQVCMSWYNTALTDLH